ncbi:hypothetical protein UAW_01857 [Enterococcus haemoperoxidus ATCC BAA-382]|uniref:Uncharacterized protein n=1 Tax=Enterococcus haemoperoxidus ATCC BAA-382 TaxID=1158608 RepID=R2QJA9_9ENTE|nr:hypothetical protein [Enterococcus haemoperoxidus]EOH96692.1 hypothetical protein UAW_01857 [Enterococcus haemoperoxidus ATCC BAA-382]EOT60188.1 hypothetical protein I583_02823 [Enterococcus haemoperoxidus ATCC BAA-382]
MTNKRYISVFGTNLAIVVYYFLPRIQITTLSPHWNMFFNFRHILVTIITLSMLIITFQKTYSNKWKNVQLNRMVVSSYILFLFATIFYFMMTEFL